MNKETYLLKRELEDLTDRIFIALQSTVALVTIGSNAIWLNTQVPDFHNLKSLTCIGVAKGHLFYRFDHDDRIYNSVGRYHPNVDGMMSALKAIDRLSFTIHPIMFLGLN